MCFVQTVWTVWHWQKSKGNGMYYHQVKPSKNLYLMTVLRFFAFDTRPLANQITLT